MSEHPTWPPDPDDTPTEPGVEPNAYPRPAEVPIVEPPVVEEPNVCPPTEPAPPPDGALPDTDPTELAGEPGLAVLVDPPGANRASRERLSGVLAGDEWRDEPGSSRT